MVQIVILILMLLVTLKQFVKHCIANDLQLWYNIVTERDDIMAQISLRLDDQLKEESTKILNDLGMDVTGAIKIFLTQVVLQEGIPFEVSLKKPELMKALEDIENNRTSSFNNLEELMADLTDED
ncbi:type II toxin-antitoxin system RelB/DinJ family antitoxin [Vagococcus fluvialis]|uniref:type II toxin-antitoxin system RelB/DinJ family antitoxin n=1 Tax=Vagococcus fluvialis TaxID=2738 RepID=UPI003B21DF13